MKKSISVLFMIFLMIGTFSFAAYPADLEEIELEALNKVKMETAEYDVMPISEDGYEVGSENPESVISDDVYKCSQNEEISDKVIDGNAYILANTVKLENVKIYGNLYVMANDVEIINSDFASAVYIMANNVEFTGYTNDLYAMAESINIKSDAYIWRSAKIMASNLEFDGSTNRDIYAMVDKLSVGDNAIVEGKLHYTSPNEGDFSSSAQIYETEFTQKDYDDDNENLNNKSIGDYIYKIILAMLVALVVSVTLVFFVSKFEKLNRTDKQVNDFVKAFLIGLGVLVLLPIISILLIVSVIGITIGLALLSIYGLILCIATAVFSLEIAYRILSKKGDIQKRNLIMLSVGISAIIAIIKFIPVIGGIVFIITFLCGMGVLWNIMFGKSIEK